MNRSFTDKKKKTHPTDGPYTFKKMLNLTQKREMQMKTTRRYYFIPIRLAKIWSLTMHSCWGCRETGSLQVGTQNAPPGRKGNVAVSIEITNHRPFYAKIPLLGIDLLLVPAMFKYHVYKIMHGNTVLTNKLMETTQVVFIYRGLVKQATVIIHCKVRL